jgi:propanol-preferring alcohol dehydrogenase
MRAMVLNRIASLADHPQPLELVAFPDPVPNRHELLVHVSVCGVCHTELDEIEGRTPPPLKKRGITPVFRARQTYVLGGPR